MQVLIESDGTVDGTKVTYMLDEGGVQVFTGNEIRRIVWLLDTHVSEQATVEITLRHRRSRVRFVADSG